MTFWKRKNYKKPENRQWLPGDGREGRADDEEGLGSLGDNATVLSVLIVVVVPQPRLLTTYRTAHKKG